MLQYASLIPEFHNEAWDSKPTTQFSGLKRHDGHTVFTSVDKRTVHFYIKASTVLSAALSPCLWTWIIYTVHMGLTSYPEMELRQALKLCEITFPQKWKPISVDIFEWQCVASFVFGFALRRARVIWTYHLGPYEALQFCHGSSWVWSLKLVPFLVPNPFSVKHSQTSSTTICLEHSW